MQLVLATCIMLFAATLAPAAAQRITTIQLDGVQYFISRMNPYSPELNYFLAYQYCRSLGLQLASFETKEKADSITTYLTNAGYNKYDFWTSGNNLGTDMYLWMSTGLPFNATFNYMRRMAIDVPAPHSDDSIDPLDVPQGSTAPQRTARHGLYSRTEHVMTNGCVALKAPTFHWEPQHCGEIKDFICEQTRCYYYNYGSIPVSSAQGKPLSLTTTTTAHPLTSSSPPPPRSEHLPTHFTLNDLIGKLRPSSLDGLQSPHLKTGALLKSPPQIDSHYSRAADAHSHDQEQKEEPTQGPYADDEGMVGDDPAAYLSQDAAHEAASADEAPSTAEPDATEHSVHASGMLAPPAY
ncbi:uncharacterized protein LOC128674747 isoform X4 [Plodia interpunctella]|uniref:uncharacterized protein LOC128674747 isoform X4 n=2 Tax=Plodia interpunctella TaxID=58824 RepID=UPI002367E272|nr:uncharacterized protein LOC128674747 isoform X1 [Plodia interpunctella]